MKRHLVYLGSLIMSAVLQAAPVAEPSSFSPAPREANYPEFMQQQVTPFWQQGQQQTLTSTDGLPLQIIRFHSPQHQQVIMVVNGRLESFLKYQELAYDLFQQGYDVVMFDHRGQGLSGRMLADRHKGYVADFSDYQRDMKQVYQTLIAGQGYQQAFLLAHSMGGAVSAGYLETYPQDFTAAALSAPMLGIALPLPHWLTRSITGVAEWVESWAESYAPGTGPYKATPFATNDLTHSEPRYQWFRELYAANPNVQLGGPTLHWIREGMQAGEDAITHAPELTTPLLLLQGGQDSVVDNEAHRRFCTAMAQAGHPCEGNQPYVIDGARHELLFEQDPLRTQALRQILAFFARY